jgi:putative restriction endonuclease
MALADLLAQKEWDRPIFKRLPSNDTGEAPGHQGGVVIPKDLRPFFPGLTGTTSADNPTLDHRITAELFDGAHFLGMASTRYQFQTWGGTRSPESRLTDELGPLRNRAKAGDVLLIQRAIDELDRYRLILVRQGTSDFAYTSKAVGSRKWGSLGNDLPLSDPELRRAEKEQGDREEEPFQLFDLDPRTSETTGLRVARSVAFRQKVYEIYRGRCSVCSSGIKTPSGTSELDAAHIVPRGKAGADDARNGLALCKTHHWAFDRGLFSITPKRLVTVPAVVRAIQLNDKLAALNNQPIVESVDDRLRAHSSALEWHVQNVLLR